MKKILICGNYGATNIGDEAILAGILRIIRQSYPKNSSKAPEITVLSANPQNTTALHNVKSLPLLPAGPRSFFRGLFNGGIIRTLDAIRTCDGFILGGGGLFNDEKPLSIIIWGLQAKFALLFRKPLMCIGQSVGPLNNFFSRFLVRAIYSRCRAVSVRDSASQKLLHELNLPIPQTAADPAFMLHIPEPVSAEREKYIVLSLRNWHKNMPADMHNSFARFIEDVYLTFGLKTVLVPFSSYPENDTVLLDNIFAQLKNKDAAEVFEFSNDFAKVLELMQKAKAVVGMRLHSLIFATLTQTPFLALSYSRKVSSFANESGMEDYSLALNDLSEKSLMEKFTRLMADYDRVKGKIIEKNIFNRASAVTNVYEMKVFIDSL